MEVLVVISATAIILFLAWILMRMTGRNIDLIFKIIKIDLILSFLLAVIVWCFKVFLTHKILEVDYTTFVLFFACFLMLLNTLYWLAYYKWNRFSESVNRDLEIGGIFTRQMLFYLIDIIAPPAFSISSAWYLLSTYHIK